MPSSTDTQAKYLFQTAFVTCEVVFFQFKYPPPPKKKKPKKKKNKQTNKQKNKKKNQK